MISPVTLIKAISGNAEAEFETGLNSYNEINFIDALHWFRNSANKGNASAQYYLGLMYYAGHGVEADLEEACRWHQKAAEQGHPVAQSELGASYFIRKQYNLASKWLILAAEQGQAGAQVLLANMYLFGKGLAQNEQEAYFWLIVATASGTSIPNDDEVKSVVSELENELDGLLIDHIQARAFKWIHQDSK